VRVKVVVGKPLNETTSPSASQVADVVMPLGGRALGHTNSIGCASSTQRAPNSREAVHPATTPCRCDHSQAA
jgi:hypothetical protein